VSATESISPLLTAEPDGVPGSPEPPPPPAPEALVRSRMASALVALSLACGALVVAIGATAAVGWIFRVEGLKRLRLGAISMNPLTALLLILAGASLLLSNTRALRRPRCGAVAAVLGAVIMTFGLAKLASLAFGFDFRLDHLLFPESLKHDYKLFDNAMAPNTALNFLLSGVALVLLNMETRRRQSLAQTTALAAGMVALLALVGYLYRSTEIFSFGHGVPMALPTAIAFALLSVGILGARPDRGLMRFLTGPGPGAVMVRRLLPGCLLIPIALGWIRLAGERAGYFSTATGVAILVVSSIVVFGALIATNAGLIDRTESQRRQAHQALRESEVFYHSLVESLPQNILRKDLQGRFTFANRRCCETFGKPFSAILGKTDLDLFPLPLAEKYREDDARVLREQRAYETTEEHVTPDGSSHYVQIIKAPLTGPDGRVIGIQVIFWDVTEQIRAAQQLRSQNEKLQAMAESERAAHEELKSAQSRMVQSAKLAGLGEMVAGVAHEINNPLSFVSNNVAVLQRDLSDVQELVRLYRKADPLIEPANPDLAGEIHELWERGDLEYTLGNLQGLLARTREGLKRIQRIVGDLRIFARLDEGELDDVDLNAGIESTVNIVLGNAKKRQVAIAMDLQPLPTISCFAAKINQVVMNLVSNAIDASDEGGEVVVRSRPETAGVRIEVEDHGCGIDPAVRDRIFDPFFTTKPIGVGTGLGLSISYGIVVDHGGQIEVEYAPGQGAKFIIHLPLKVPGRAKRGRDEAHPPTPGGTDPSSPR
jgi:PAS domain S-box-containing protein